MTKGVSQGQEFFVLHYFSHQNGPKSKFHTFHHKTLARDYFVEIKASLMIFSHFNASSNFLSHRFCIDWRKLILKGFDYVSYTAKPLQNQFFPL